MSKITISICCLCIAFICWSRVSGSNMLVDKKLRGAHSRSDIPSSYKSLVATAQKELGVREKTGRNDGKQVEAYLALVGLKKGEPWCAAFVSWVYQQAAYPLPRTGWSPALFPSTRQLRVAMPGDVFGIYFPALKRIGHCGIVGSVYHSWIRTVEGNTNGSGGREGDGVYSRLRHQKSIRAYASWR